MAKNIEKIRKIGATLAVGAAVVASTGAEAAFANNIGNEQPNSVEQSDAKLYLNILDENKIVSISGPNIGQKVEAFSQGRALVIGMVNLDEANEFFADIILDTDIIFIVQDVNGVIAATPMDNTEHINHNAVGWSEVATLDVVSYRYSEEFGQFVPEPLTQIFDAIAILKNGAVLGLK